MSTASQDHDSPPTAFTRAVAERLAGVDGAALHPTALERARHALLDWLGTTLTGSTEPGAQIVRRVVAAEGGAPHSSVLGTAMRTSAQRAALANGQAAHAIDFDDSFPPAQTHGTACIATASFAAAQARGSDGRALLEAIVAGFDALHLVGPAIGPSHYARGFHNTGTLGAIGAAAAAGRLAGLEPEPLAAALGLAANQAAGFKAVFGTMAKPLNAGKAAASGLLAVELVAAGFTAPFDAIEAPVGFAWTHSDDFDAARAPFGDAAGAGIGGTIFKLHACCHATHSTLEGMRELVAAHALEPDAVERIVLEISEGSPDICGIAAPDTGLEGKFSLAHVAALALTRGDTGPGGFTDEVVRDPRLRAIRERVELRPVASRGMFASEVTVVMADGTSHRAEVDVLRPAGDDQLADQWDVLAAKLIALAAPVVGAAAAAGLRDEVARLDGAPSVEPLAALARVDHA